MSIFRGISYFGQLTPRTIIRENIINRISQSLIDAGGYYNFTTGIIGYDGYSLAQLRPAYRQEFSNFKFWAGNSSNWVWETQNATYTGGQPPISASGIWISGIFYPENNGGVYDHYIDYARGGVVFTNPMPSGLNVFCNHSERVGFVYSSIGPEYKRIFNAHLRNWKTNPPGSGYDELPNELKAFLPAVFVDIRRDSGDPYELGSSVRLDRFNVSFDIISEDVILQDFLIDACMSLQNQTIIAYDATRVRDSGLYPLDYKGRKNPSGLSFSDRSSNYFWKNLKFDEQASEIESFIALPLIRGGVVMDLEVII